MKEEVYQVAIINTWRASEEAVPYGANMLVSISSYIFEDREKAVACYDEQKTMFGGLPGVEVEMNLLPTGEDDAKDY